MIIDLTGYDIKAGFCDRLWQVSFCATVADLRGEKTLYFREVPSQWCPSRIADLLHIQGFECKTWDVSLGEAEYRLSSSPAYPSLRNVKQLKPPNLNMSDEAFLALWLAMYKRFSPRKDIQEKVEHIGVNNKCIGLHIRFTDKINNNPFPWEINPGELQQVEERTAKAIQSALKKYRLKKVYLATDCAKARLAWRNKLESWGATVLLNPYALYDENQFRQTSGEDFLVDLFSLAHCRSIVGSINSGVPLTAARIGGLDEHEIVLGRYASRRRRILRALKNQAHLASPLIAGVKRLKGIATGLRRRFTAERAKKC